MKRILTAIGIGLAISLGTVLMPVSTRPQPANAVESSKYDGDCTGTETVGRCADKPLAFDHSQCQYPERSTNPIDGCDNSDPCDPANAAKGGSGDCSDAICPGVTGRDESCAAVAPPVVVNQCEGK